VNETNLAFFQTEQARI